MKAAYRFLCCLGCIPYKYDLQDEESSFLQLLSLSSIRGQHCKIAILAFVLHTVFIITRLVQAFRFPKRKFFLLFMHFTWGATFLLCSVLIASFALYHRQIRAYCNGLFQFYGSHKSIPGATVSGKNYHNNWIQYIRKYD